MDPPQGALHQIGQGDLVHALVAEHLGSNDIVYSITIIIIINITTHPPLPKDMAHEEAPRKAPY